MLRKENPLLPEMYRWRRGIASKGWQKSSMQAIRAQTGRCGKFLLFFYEHLAEPLAISRQDLDEDPAEANACGDIGDSIVDLPDWLSNDDDMLNRLPYMFSGDGSKPQIQKRWLPTMTSAQLHDLYKDIHADHETLASWTTFQRVWVRFQSVMGVRPVTLHSRCDDCARYSASFDFSACCPAVTFSHGPFFYSVTFSWRMIEVWKQELKITCVHWGSQPSINPIILLTRLHVWRCKTARSLSKTSKQSIRSGCRQSCLQQPYPGCLPRQKHHTRDGDHGWKHESFGRCGAATPDGHYRCYGQEQVACTAKSGLIKTLGSFVATSLACCWRSHSWSTWIFCNCRAWCQGRLPFAANSPCPCLRLGRGWTPETRQRHAMESHFPQWQYKQRGAQFSASSFCHCAGVLTALCRSVFGHVPCRTHTQQAGSEIQCDWVFACAGEMLANTRRVCQPFARALSLSSWCPSADRASWRQLPLAQFFCTFGSTLCRRDRYSEHSWCCACVPSCQAWHGQIVCSRSHLSWRWWSWEWPSSFGKALDLFQGLESASNCLITRCISIGFSQSSAFAGTSHSFDPRIAETI